MAISSDQELDGKRGIEWMHKCCLPPFDFMAFIPSNWIKLEVTDSPVLLDVLISLRRALQRSGEGKEWVCLYITETDCEGGWEGGKWTENSQELKKDKEGGERKGVTILLVLFFLSNLCVMILFAVMLRQQAPATLKWFNFFQMPL